MCPSTEDTDAQSEFAVRVSRKLLRYIVENNDEERYTFLVLYAWTTGPMMHLVYKAPPSDIIWGLIRDTRESLIDQGPWPDEDEAVRYYYVLDLEGIQPAASTSQSGEPDEILWLGDLREDLPKRPSEISDAHRYIPPPATPSTADKRQVQRVVNEPRRYGNPL
jgi:hypothetical protein